MFTDHFGTRRSWRVGGHVLVVLLLGSPAWSEPAQSGSASGARACLSTLRSAQEKQHAGRLVEASQLFTKCSNQACGGFLWQECASSHTRLHASLPSVVPVVLDEGSDPLVDIQVQIDGQLVASRLDGLAVPVDPGQHELSFSTAAGVFASKTITVIEGEHNRPVAVVWPPAPMSPNAKAPAKASSPVAN